MWPIPTTAPSIVQFIMLIGCTLMGLSHILQPQMWTEYFARLNAQGTAGLVTKVLAVELWPAMLIVSLHQVWHGAAIVLTVYGWLQLTKVAVALLIPKLGMRSMALAERGARGFVAAGVMLLAIGASAGLALLGY